MQATYRRLGATEQAVWLRDRAVPLHFALTAQVQGLIEPGCLKNALRYLQQKHPLLRAKVALQPDGSPYFVEQTASIACRIVSRQDAAHWQREVMQQLSQPFDWTAAPLIRVVLLHSSTLCDLIVVCHHAIADGMAAVNLIQEILSFLANSPQPEVSAAVPLPLEALLPHSQAASNLKKALGTGVLVLQQLWQQHRPKPRSATSPPLRVEAGQLSPEVTQQLIHRCRQEETTVHAAICAAWLFAIARSHRSSKKLLHCFSPVNLRPYLCTQLKQACGVYISPAQTTHILTAQTQFWQTARSLKSQLMGQVEEHQLAKLKQQHELLMAIKPRPEFVQQLFTQHCTSDVMVTNLGRLAAARQYGDLYLKAVYGPTVLSGFGQERVCGAATLGDRLSYTVVCQSLESELALINQVVQLLETAAVAPEIALLHAEQVTLAENSTAPLQSV